MKLRIKFRKDGVMKYIGHLDLIRFFQKAIRRADIDVAYSTGYSPHQLLSFAAPLGVGLTSMGEYFDVSVESYESTEDILKRLNKEMVPGMEILQVTELGEHAKNAMASVAAASYRVFFREGKEPPFDWEARLPLFAGKSSIPVTKQTKRNEILMDLRPNIYRMELRHEQERPYLYLLVDASSSGNIKPALVLKAFFEENGAIWEDSMIAVVREEVYANLGTKEQPRFLPLGEAGKAEAGKND